MARSTTISHSLTDTPFGEAVVLWANHHDVPLVHRVLISRPGIPVRQTLLDLFPDSKSSTCSEMDVLLSQIKAFLNGTDIRFSLDNVRLDSCSPFQRSVLLAEYGIPRRQVSTYQLIANHIGNPKGTRAVGTALATNPFPIIIPCHRAIRSDGSLGGYQGGLKMKRSLLEMEGIAFQDSGRVSTRDFYYHMGYKRSS